MSDKLIVKAWITKEDFTFLKAFKDVDIKRARDFAKNYYEKTGNPVTIEQYDEIMEVYDYKV